MKKFLSIVLVSAMLLAICPVAFATDTANTDTFDGYEYVFTRDALGSPDADVEWETLLSYTFESVDSYVSDSWQIAAQSGAQIFKVNSDGVYFCSNELDTDGALAIKIRVEQGGTYVPKLTYIAKSDAPIIDVYLAKEGVSSNGASTSEFEFIKPTSGKSYGKLYTFLHKDSDTSKYGVEEKEGIYTLKKGLNMHNATKVEKTENFGNVEIDLEAGNYYLIYDVNGKDDLCASGSPDTILKSFSLTPVAGKHEYEFNSTAYGSEAKLKLADLAGKTLQNVVEGKSAPWRIAAKAYLTEGDYTYADTDAFRLCMARHSSDAAIAIELQVGAAGTYVPKLTYDASNSSPIVDLYLVEEGTELGGIKTSEFTVPMGNTTTGGGLYVFTHSKNGSYYMEEQAGIYVLKKGVNMNETSKAERHESFGNRELTLNSGKYYLICVINPDSKAITGYQGSPDIYLKSFSLTSVKNVVKEEFTPSVDNTTPVTNSASVKMLAYYGDTQSTIGEVANVTYGKSVAIPAPERTVEIGGKKYTFRYWTKGLETGIANRQAISTALSFDYMPHEGANFLIAVYEEEGNAKEAFYNYNGQLLTDLEIVEDMLPPLPSMAGFGPAQKWEQLGTGELFDANADVSELSGDKVFMAKYGDKISDIMINGKAYAYGDPVEFNSDDSNFSYWTRTIDGVREIVSVSPNYTFRAFTDCTVEAVCNGKIEVESPCKILLSTFSVGDMTAVMAEFIGFEDAKEKGIMFGETQKIAMTTDYAQFTVTNDKKYDVEVKGYAVVGEKRLVGDSITVAGAPLAE